MTALLPRLGAALCALVLVASLSACASSSTPEPAPRAEARAPQRAAARGGQRGGQRGAVVEAQLASMRTAVGLSDEQAARVRTILEAQVADRPARGAGGDREAVRAQMQERRARALAEVEAVLTPDQVERYRSWQAAQRAEGGRGGRRGGPPNN